MSAGNPRCRIRNARSDGLFPVIPANYHDLSVTAEHESAAIVSGATDVFRLAALIRACRFLPNGRWISAARRPDVADVPPARACMVAVGVPADHFHGWAETPTPTVGAHPWHQDSIRSCIMGTHFQVNAGIRDLDPGPGPGVITPRA